MNSKFCHHLHQDGTYCQSPPMRGRDYCYTHLQLLGRRMQMAKARACAQKSQLHLPLPEDLHGVQVAIAQLMDAVATDRVDPGRARVLLSALRLAASNLKSRTPWDLRRFESGNPTGSQLLADPNFESNYGLPEGLDLQLPPEVAFPPPAHAEPADAPPFSPSVGDWVRAKSSANPSIPVTVADIALWRHLHEASVAARQSAQKDAAQALSKSQPAPPDSPCARLEHRALELIATGCTFQTTPFDLELMEIAKAEGNAAMMKRVRQHEIDELRQERRRKTRAARARLAGEAQARNAAKLAAQLLKERSWPALTGEPTPSSDPSADESLRINKKPPQTEAAGEQAENVSG